MNISKQQEAAIKTAVFDWYNKQISFDFSWAAGVIEVEFPCLESSEDLRRKIESILNCPVNSDIYAKNQDEWFLVFARRK